MRTTTAFAAGRCSASSTRPSTTAGPGLNCGYKRIRGVDGFGAVERGVRGLVEAGGGVSLRCTLQRDNYQEMPALIHLARAWGVRQISFLAVDDITQIAFARQADFNQSMALRHDDLSAFAHVLDEVEREFATDFADGFIAESPAKLYCMRKASSPLSS